MNRGGITLEDNVLVGPKVNLITTNHPTDPAERRSTISLPIVLKQGAWIGANVTVMPGVTIGENAIVGAGAQRHVYAGRPLALAYARGRADFTGDRRPRVLPGKGTAHPAAAQGRGGAGPARRGALARRFAQAGHDAHLAQRQHRKGHRGLGPGRDRPGVYELPLTARRCAPAPSVSQSVKQPHDRLPRLLRAFHLPYWRRRGSTDYARGALWPGQLQPARQVQGGAGVGRHQ
nr:maltose O-acetyltransferase [Tanacetum cinerariifolium]